MCVFCVSAVYNNPAAPKVSSKKAQGETEEKKGRKSLEGAPERKRKGGMYV